MKPDPSRLFIALTLSLFATSASGDETTLPLRFYDDVKNRFIQAPGIAADIRTSIEGTIARTTVTQYFLNDTEQWQEGIYQFPLPDDAAVDSLTMMIGKRRVIGFVTGRDQAKEIYATAKAKGQAAGLVDQNRPNLFKSSVANIPPKSLIGIEISYQGDVRLDDQRFSLRIPLAITPRYERTNSDELRHLVTAAGQDWADDVVDRLALTDFAGGNNPVSLTLTLRPGFETASVDSRSHRIAIEEKARDDDQGEIYEITLADGVTPGSSDFTLDWVPAAQVEPHKALYTEKLDDGYYSHLLIMPSSGQPFDDQPSEGATPATPPKRQVTFIIDVSGSMDGPSIEQAKQALILALDDLEEHDLFNIIAFSDSFRKIFPQPALASERQIAIAKAAVGGLAADGGTEMMPALIEALIEPEVNSHLRQIVFITDGAINYEDQISATIKKLVGEARFFAIGIGAAPNAHLMRHIAMAGRGTYTFIDDVDAVERELTALFRKMKAPVLTDLKLDLPAGLDAEILPAKLPDLMAGEPVSVAIRSKKPLRTLSLQGRRGDQAWRQPLQIDQPRSADGISKIFARRKIEALTFDRLGLDDQATKDEITVIAIRHQLISDHTSLVAVDEAILRSNKAPLIQKRYDPTLPAGWQVDRLSALEAERSYRRLMDDISSESSTDAPQNQLRQQINLPQTATGFQFYLALGLTFMLAASALLIFQRRSQHA